MVPTMYINDPIPDLKGDETLASADLFYPCIDLSDLCRAMRLDGSVTAERLRHAADLALRMAGDGLTDPNRLHKLAAWFDAANRTRDLLRTTVRADLAVVELLLAWVAANQQPKGNNR